MPKVSIILPAYNCQDSIKKAVDSIISQTFTDWECIICDDGSTDKTWEKINVLVGNNKKFILLRNKANMGIAVTLNRCINFASGDYLARQDADDVSINTRIEEQAGFLDSHKDISVVGTHAYLFDKDGRRWGEFRPPEFPDKIDWIKGFFVIHASAMMRRRHILEIGRYYEKLVRAQDYNLWLNLLIRGYKVQAIPKILYGIHWDTSDYVRRSLKHRLLESKIIFNGLKTLKVSRFYYLYIFHTLFSGLLHPWILHLYYLHRFTKKGKGKP